MSLFGLGSRTYLGVLVFKKFFDGMLDLSEWSPDLIHLGETDYDVMLRPFYGHSFNHHLTGAQLKKHIDATLGSGNLREAVRLPPGEDLNEWLAVNSKKSKPYDFVNYTIICYPVLMSKFRYEYRWADGVTIKKPIEVSAPKYVEYLMDWIESQLDDESMFPQKLGAPFPPNFQDVVKTIFKRLFRVYAHIYHTHFQKIVSLKEEAHLNTCFKHFVLFTWEFRLIDKGELAPLYELVESILQL
ncbi:hypothetical protein C3L33_03520, partial [Rhododendron williamsianum]